MPAESLYEDGEVAPRGTRAPGSESDDDGLGQKRKHKKKDKDERAQKRHKEHKTKEHKKDKKHKKEKEDEDSDQEKEKTNGASKGLDDEDRQRDASPKKREEDRPPAKDRSPQQRPREAGRSRSPPRRRSRSNERRRSPPRGRSPPRRSGYGRSPPRSRYGSAGYDRNRGNDRYRDNNRRDGRRGDDRRDDRRQITEERRQDELKKEKERDEQEAVRKKKEEEDYAAKVAAQFESMQDHGAFDDDGVIVEEDEEEKAERERKERKERMEKIKAEAAKKAEEKAAEIAKEEAEKRANGTASGEASPLAIDVEIEEENDRQILAAITPRAKTAGDPDSDNEEEDEEMRAGDVDELGAEARKELERATGLSPRKSKQADLEQNIVYDIFDKSDTVAKAREVKAIDRGTNALATENFDDKDGYLTFQMGELFFDRYEVKRVLGKGVFSTVLGAEDTKYPKEQTKDKKPVNVAIKIIRNNDMMAKCGAKELEFLKLLAKDGGAEKHHIVQLSDDFVHHGHMCLVFEPMAMNLREVIKKFGHNRGINIEGVQVFSKQMFQALKHLRKCKIVHADIKPDNILINERHNAIKVCDFGSGSYINECDITPYLVSRWYRAPEITLCLRYDYSIDLWSIACCMYELYTGKVMFPGNSNNDMLRRFMETQGRFPNKLIKRSTKKMIELGRPVDFTDDFKFMRIMIDKITKKETVKILTIDEKPVKDLLKQLMPTQLQPDQARKVKQLCDVLHGALSLNPDNRFSIEQCLHHQFIKEPFGFVPKRREQAPVNATLAT